MTDELNEMEQYLVSWSWQHFGEQVGLVTYIETGFQIRQVFLEGLLDMCSCGLPTWDPNTVRSARGYVDHLLEFGMFEGLNWLVRCNQPLDCCLLEKFVCVR